MMDTTLDGMLNRRVALEQPKDGFRVAVDTVLLAASVPARAGERCLDFGCGAGGAMLCLAVRVPGLRITGIELQPELAALCRRNIARNAWAEGLDVREGDVTDLPPALAAEWGADHVFMNPPYHEAARHDVSARADRRIANTEKEGDLARWIAAAARALKTGGMLTLIHRADRLEEIIRWSETHFGGIEILPVLPREGAAAGRVILRAKKGAAPAPPRHARPLVLHGPGGGYTPEADDILRHAQAAGF